MIHEETRLTMMCDREGCKNTVTPKRIDEWNVCALADEAWMRGWAVRDHPYTERHLCPKHAPERPASCAVDHRPLGGR